MKFTNKNIVPDSNPKLREKSVEYKHPITKKEREELLGLLEYVKNSIDQDLAEKYDLSPAVGIAAPQVGILKRGFAVYIEAEDTDDVISVIMTNPKILAYSVENVFVDGGEACLSVAEEHIGNIMRHAYVKVKYTDIDGNDKTEEFYDFPSIAIQHELDHLNGVLFYDKINKKNPLEVPENSHPL